MEHKIKLTNEQCIASNGEILYRIQALVDIPEKGVQKGDKGGFITSLEVSGNARVSGNAWVSGDAQVYGNAQVCGNAQVYGNAVIDSPSDIIVLIIAAQYSVTITRQYVAIGCKEFKRKDIKTITPDKAEAEGLPKEFYTAYRQMVLGAMKMVKPIKRVK